MPPANRRRFRGSNRRRGLGVVSIPPRRRRDPPETLADLVSITVAQIRKFPVELSMITSFKRKLNKKTVFTQLFFRVTNAMSRSKLRREGLLHYIDRRKLLEKMWGELDEEIKNALSDYALALNGLHVSGLVQSLPNSIVASGGLSKSAMEDITDDWRYLTMLVRRAMKKGYSRLEASTNMERQVSFTPHKVTVGTQIFRRNYNMSRNLFRYIFGRKYERVSKYIVHQTSAVIVLNIASHQLLNSIFTLEGLSLFSFWPVHDVAYHGCGKLQLDVNGAPRCAYILKEKETSLDGSLMDGTYTSRWTVRDDENNEFTMKGPTYNNFDKRYVFNKEIYSKKHGIIRITFDNDEYAYDPIRIVIHKTGSPRITFCMSNCALKKRKHSRATIIDTEQST